MSDIPILGDAKGGWKDVDEHLYGVYVWEMDDGKIVQDSDGHMMNIKSRKDDQKQLAKLKDAAAYYGVSEGHPKWLQGHRPVTDDEYDDQKTRQALGLVPDEMDLGAMYDDLRLNR